MNNQSFKNILIVSVALFGIMVVSTALVVGFNRVFELSTNLANEDVLTAISFVAFCIAVVWKFLFDKLDKKN